MAGEVLDRGQHSLLVGAANVCRSQVAYLPRILPERPGVDDGVGGVGINVGVGEEIPVNPNGARFKRSDAAKIFGILWFSRRSECHGMWENRGAIQAHRQAALEVG